METIVSRIYNQKLNEIQSRIPVKLFANQNNTFANVLNDNIKASNNSIGVSSNTSLGSDLLQTKDSNLVSTANSTPSIYADMGKTPYDSIIDAASMKYGVDKNLIKAVIKAESDFNPKVVSSAGAMGLMQLMPENVKEYGITNAFDPVQNIDAGTHQLKDLLKRYNGDVKMALAAYNCGSGALKKQGVTNLNSEDQMAKLYSETRNYVKKIMRYLKIA